MTSISKSQTEPHPNKLPIVKVFLRYSRYIGLGLITNIALWGAALFYLKVAPPVYTSKWALIMPGTGVGVNVNLPEIGEASSSSSSPFGSASMDPRANYQFIITDESVLTIAAESLKIPVSKLGKPKVKLVDNTSIMELEINANSAEAARGNAIALYNALLTKLDILRAQEIKTRQESNEKTLESARAKLQEAQKKLSAYKATSGLSSSNQINDLSNNIEQLRKQKAEMVAQREQVSNRFQELSVSLGLTVPEVADAFVLHADRQFLQNAKDYSEASAALAIMLNKWDVNHPSVIKETERQKSARTAMLERANSLLSKEVNDKYIDRLVLGDNSGTSRENLFRDLIAFRAEQQGITAQNEALQEQILQLEARLQMLVQKQFRLDSLQRDVQIAEAVFASTLAKMDLSKSDIFIAYPLVQLLSEPTLPEKKTSPQPTLIFLGTGVGSLLITNGLVLLWWRKEIKRKILPKKTTLEISA